jgi:hypothetical protein
MRESSLVFDKSILAIRDDRVIFSTLLDTTVQILTSFRQFSEPSELGHRSTKPSLSKQMDSPLAEMFGRQESGSVIAMQ